jgi:hypothetical protein
MLASLGNTLILVCGILFLLGSFVNIISSAVSGTNVISMVFFPLLCYMVLCGRFSRAGFLAIIGFVIFIFSSYIALILYPTPENFRLVRAAMVAASGVFWGSWISNRYPIIANRVVLYSFFISLVVALLQVSYLSYGIGLDPAARFKDVDFLKGSIFESGFPSFFTNSNDFSVFATLVFLYFLFGTRLIDKVFMVLALIAVMLSGSKLTVMICLLGLIIAFNQHRKLMILIGLIFIVIFYLLDPLNFYFFARLVNTITEIISGEVDAASSVSLRAETYMFFIKEYPRFLLGSFNASLPFPQFNIADFDVGLMSVNPHSMIIELHGLFGVFGLVISISMLMSLWIKLSSSWQGVKLSFLFFSLITLTFISSSTLHIGAFFGLVSILVNSKHTYFVGRSDKNNSDIL